MLDENLGDVPYMPGSDQYTGLNKIYRLRNFKKKLYTK